LEPLEQSGGSYLCSEGDVVVLRTHTQLLPRLRLCGQDLYPRGLDQSEQGFTAEFDRLIDTWAGRTVLTLEGGPDTETIRLDIDPHRRKLGPGAWEAMIRELCEVSASLPWGLSPGGAGGRTTPDALANVHPAIIEQELPAFQRLLRQLLADPPTTTLRIRTVRPLELSRRLDLHTMRWLSRRPLELAGVRGLATDDQPADPRALADQPEALVTLDHPVTRYVAHLLERVRRRLAATALSLRSSAKHGVPDPAATSYARQLAENVEAAAGAIQAVQRAPLFRTVKPEPLNDSVIQSLPDHPLYAAIHRIGRRLLQPGLAYAPGEELQSALKHSYDLFELMVLYRLVKAIDEGLPTSWSKAREAKVRRLPREDRPADRSAWRWEGPGECQLELHYQPLFRSAVAPPDSHHFSSLSAQGVPDYVLVLRRAGVVASWLLLDAKYRSGRQSIHDALGDMHRYRDSLRLAGSRAAGAYIIVPALAAEAALYGQPGYIGAHSLGALQVSSEDWLRQVWTWMQQFCSEVARAKLE
jgi:PD-(D/E)XK nuclease superfamily protein/uncharacterized protein DUF2357